MSRKFDLILDHKDAHEFELTIPSDAEPDCIMNPAPAGNDRLTFWLLALSGGPYTVGDDRNIRLTCFQQDKMGAGPDVVAHKKKISDRASAISWGFALHRRSGRRPSDDDGG